MSMFCCLNLRIKHQNVEIVVCYAQMNCSATKKRPCLRTFSCLCGIEKEKTMKILFV